MSSVPPVPPKVYEQNPEDEFTSGSKAWLAIIITSGVLEAYALWYDHTHPGNRKKWTLTSNVRTAGGFDSVTGSPIDVKFGTTRRVAVLLGCTWLLHHFTSRRGQY